MSALGEPLDNSGKVWAVRAYYKPYIRLIWLGALLMGFGGLLGAFERRLRKRVEAALPAQVNLQEAKETQVLA